MAVVFAVVGGGAIVGIANSDPYYDHSDYSNYGNYSNYSDAAERRRRRIAAKEEEIRQGVQEINQYKINRVNSYLNDSKLISASGETVSVDAVKNDGNEKITREEKNRIVSETKNVRQEISEIDELITAIDKILEENKL